MITTIRCALIQYKVGLNKWLNLDNAIKLVEIAKRKGGELIILPEYFSTPIYQLDNHVETIPDGPSCKMLSENSKNHEIYLVGGTIVEGHNGKIYNTCTVWNPYGEMIAKYRKIHLCDIDIPGRVTYKESEILSSGNELATFHVKDMKVGLGICYDMRFEELAKLYRLLGCQILIYPAAFNMTTGPMHWDLIQRIRANDNQLFIFTASPARGEKGYISWGHSQITDPWGKVIVSAGKGEEIIYADLDGDECKKVRQQIPIGVHRRLDVYDTLNMCD